MAPLESSTTPSSDPWDGVFENGLDFRFLSLEDDESIYSMSHGTQTQSGDGIATDDDEKSPLAVKVPTHAEQRFEPGVDPSKATYAITPILPTRFRHSMFDYRRALAVPPTVQDLQDARNQLQEIERAYHREAESLEACRAEHELREARKRFLLNGLLTVHSSTADSALGSPSNRWSMEAAKTRSKLWEIDFNLVEAGEVPSCGPFETQSTLEHLYWFSKQEMLELSHIRTSEIAQRERSSFPETCEIALQILLWFNYRSLQRQYQQMKWEREQMKREQEQARRESKNYCDRLLRLFRDCFKIFPEESFALEEQVLMQFSAHFLLPFREAWMEYLYQRSIPRIDPELLYVSWDKACDATNKLAYISAEVCSWMRLTEDEELQAREEAQESEFAIQFKACSDQEMRLRSQEDLEWFWVPRSLLEGPGGTDELSDREHVED